MADTRSLRQLNRATLARQSPLDRGRGPVAGVIGGLAGLQAQHADPPYVALWSRRAAQTIADLEAALVDRSVVKATVMRSTLHLVAATDYPAYDAATAEARVANWRATARRAGVDLDKLHASLLEYCDEPRTVAEIEPWIEERAPGLAAAAPAGVRNTAFRAASSGGGLVHVPPSGLWRSHGKPRYVAARSWLGGFDQPSADEGLCVAVELYLVAYGPASIEDIGKWLGQTRLPRIRTALDTLGERIVRATSEDGRALVDIAGCALPSPDEPAPPRFLSRWDSALIGYDARDRILPARHTAAVAKANADFLPTFLIDGFVAGLWSVETRGDDAVLRLEPFSKVSAADRRALADEGERLVRFHEPDARRHEVVWAD